MTGERDRGQLLLLTGILIAVVIVGSVVLLNGIQFSEHTGSETTLRSAQSADHTETEVRTNVRQLLTGMDEEGVAFVGSESALADALTTYNRSYVDITVDGRTGFTTLGLNDSRTRTGSLHRQSSVGSYDNGVVAEDIGVDPTAVVPFVTLTVTDQSVDGSADFTVVVTDAGTDVYEIRFTETNVEVADPTTGDPARELCADPVDGDEVRVTLAHGSGTVATAADTDCSGFTLPDIDGPATLEIENGGQAEGTLAATIGDGATAGSAAPPAVGTGVVDPAVDMRYNSPSVRYNGTIQVMGGNIVG
ncbi:hypothetical protein GJ629_04355 [Halapricum sp. CBA1109]|uniref:hypothetical protein n=1 Tax=Halapricum sp. CBA1109 TaxID=2668068 RepID=UPI0012F9B63D|nr:hypothetical protein [Halapricum sp. CBA1109]MUV89223.1 hypothetical protein [Halapricum sp. CBA1109]